MRVEKTEVTNRYYIEVEVSSDLVELLKTDNLSNIQKWRMLRLVFPTISLKTSVDFVKFLNN